MENENLNKVTLKKIKDERWEAIKIVLKASGKFDEKTLKTIESARRVNAAFQLFDSQVEVLENLKIIDNLETLRSNMSNEEIPVENLGDSEFDPVNVKEVVAGDKASREKGEEVAGKKEGEENEQEIDGENEENGQEIDGEKEENEQEIAGEEPKERDREEEPETEEKPADNIQENDELEPDNDKQNNNSQEEGVGRRYYLSGKRLIETFKRMNNGKTWETLGRMTQSGKTLREKIVDAYNSRTDANDYKSLDFLDKQLSKEKDQPIQLKDLHKAILLGTYVGYHVEKTEDEVLNLNANGEERNDAMIVKFPLVVSELPGDLKNEFGNNLTNEIVRSIEDILKSNDSYKALIILNPLDKTIDETMDRISRGLPGGEKNEAYKAYIKLAKNDFKNEITNRLPNMNVELAQFDFYDVDWNNPDTRKETIALLNKMQGEGRGNEIHKLVEEINLSFKIESPRDIAEAQSLCAELSTIANQNVQVNIAFDMDPEIAANAKAQAALDKIVNQYDNIDRDKAEETKINLDNAVADGVKRGAKAIVGATIAKEIMEMAVGADDIENPREIEGEPYEPARFPTEGSDA